MLPWLMIASVTLFFPPDWLADAYVSPNGRPAARLVDPSVDLAAERRDVWHDDWIESAPTAPAP